jgi:hypothetical protein
VAHTDDIAWWHSRFGWADLLIDGILVPFHRGELVSFRPPGWAGHGRQGSIQVPTSRKPSGGAWRASANPAGRGQSGTIGVGWPRKTRS